MRTILVLAVMAFGLCAAMGSRFAGLLLYLWFSYFRPQEWTWYGILDFRLSLAAGVSLVLPSLLTGVWPDTRNPISRLVVLFYALGLVAQIGAFHQPTGWKALEDLGINAIVSLLAVTLITSESRFLWVLFFVAGSIGVHTAKFGVSYLLHGGAAFVRSNIGFGDNNDFALTASRVLFMLIACVQLTPRRWVKLGFLGAVPLTVLCVVSTFSRGGFLALTSGVLVFLLLQKRRVLWVTSAAVVVTLGLAVVPIPDSYVQRLNTITDYDTMEYQVGEDSVKVGDDSALGRLHYWHVALEMVADNPLGVGLKNYQRAYNRYDDTHGRYGRNRAVHNSHLQVLAETGYVGLLVWFALLLVTMRTLFRVRASARLQAMTPESARFFFVTSNALIASMVAFIVGGTFLAQALNDLNWTTFALAASLDKLSLNAASAPKADVVEVAA